MINRWIKCTIKISHPMLRCKSIKLTGGIFGGLGVGGFVKSYSSTMGGYKVYTTAPGTSQRLKGLPVSASPSLYLVLDLYGYRWLGLSWELLFCADQPPRIT